MLTAKIIILDAETSNLLTRKLQPVSLYEKKIETSNLLTRKLQPVSLNEKKIETSNLLTRKLQPVSLYEKKDRNIEFTYSQVTTSKSI